MKCKICNTNFQNNRKLSKHIRDQHKHLTIKQYYDNHLKQKNDGVCLVCGQETKYVGLGEGYKKTCSQSCSAKLFRNNLKSDKEKYLKFTNKVKCNMVNEWKSRNSNGSCNTIRDKIKYTQKNTLLNMSTSEKKEKFGWLNRLSEEEKQEKIKQMISPMISFWQTSADDKIIDTIKKRQKTIIEKYGQQFPDYLLVVNDELDKKLKEFFGIE